MLLFLSILFSIGLELSLLTLRLNSLIWQKKMSLAIFLKKHHSDIFYKLSTTLNYCSTSLHWPEPRRCQYVLAGWSLTVQMCRGRSSPASQGGLDPPSYFTLFTFHSLHSSHSSLFSLHWLAFILHSLHWPLSTASLAASRLSSRLILTPNVQSSYPVWPWLPLDSWATTLSVTHNRN